MGCQSPSITIRMPYSVLALWLHAGSKGHLHMMLTIVGKFEHKDGERDICVGRKPRANIWNPSRVRKEHSSVLMVASQGK